MQTGYSHILPGKNNVNRFSLEFTAIRPWLYTHKYLQNKYSHDGNGLGFPGGSNLLNYAAEINYAVMTNFVLNLHLAYKRQGSVGNDFSINYETRSPELDENTHWLEGEISDTIKLGLVSDWQLLSHHRLLLGLSVSKYEEEDLKKEFSLSYQARY